MLTSGVWDIPHGGHTGYLRAARAIDPVNSVVITGVETDESVRLNKGVRRPVNPLADRMDFLTEFVSTDIIFAFPDAPRYEDAKSYVKRLQNLGPIATIAVPTWDPNRELKAWQAHQVGAQISLVNYRHTNSTTRMLQALGYE